MAYIHLFIFFVTGIMNVMGDCRLDPHPSVEYQCIQSSDGGFIACNTSVPVGTTVVPVCRTPNYYSYTTLSHMHCNGENWDLIEKCVPECGTVTPDAEFLAIGGTTAKKAQIPWHAGIYRKTKRPYEQICGGSLVSTHIVISAAHCFHEAEKQQPASLFLVAVGKLYRALNEKMDDGQQQSDVKLIHIPPRYQGFHGNYQDDIAVVIITKEFQLKTHIRPVCLDFNYQFEIQQLRPGVNGTVAGWGLTSANGNAALTLQVLKMPYVDPGTCINHSKKNFQELVTADKICAGTLDSDIALCKGDSGGGLVFEANNLGVQRYYLRGVVSTASKSDTDSCNTNTYIAFTSLSRQEHFIKQFGTENYRKEFKCRDGSGSISDLSHCDGIKDCADGSDEADIACSQNTCSSTNLFQCAYGACVDKGSICNKVLDCADGSDEDGEMCSTMLGYEIAMKDDLKDQIFIKKIGNCVLPPYPYHGTYTTEVTNRTLEDDMNGIEIVTVVNLTVTCDPGYGVIGSNLITCNGGIWDGIIPSCLLLCELKPHPSVEYRCLVSGNAIGSRDCNLHEPIGTIVSPRCREPDFYSTSDLTYMRCKDDGHWDYVAKCRVMCELKPHPSVEYRCLVSGNAIGSRECSHYEPIGTLVSPRCREPDFYSTSDLTFMRCKDDGHWDYVAKCSPECGKVTPEGKAGIWARKGEFPWHAGIYSKQFTPFKQICGGSLISNNLIISVAHCFYSNNMRIPASEYTVVVGKIYRPWNDRMDEAQKSEIKEIHIPKRYQGSNAYFQDDISIVIVVNAFEYKPHVRPVCLSFDYNFDRLQLQNNNKGKLGGWGLTGTNGEASPVLKLIELPFVDVGTCISKSPSNFIDFFTSDKICAGGPNSNTKGVFSSVCKGDTGGGLTFPATDRGVERYFLRGIVSIAPNTEDLCDINAFYGLTHIMKHEDFIRSFLPDYYN